MKRIINFKILDNHHIDFTFNDDTNKVIDFSPFIKDDKLSKPLADTSYFNKVQLYENGRGIFWPNEFDFCPDFLYKY
jgi:hypothetical protein